MRLNLVTGADGFVGQHLVAELLRRGEGVVGAVREKRQPLTTLAPAEAKQVQWARLELEDPDTIQELAGGFQPDRVFHLAGLSSPADSLNDSVSPMRINAIGTLYLLEAIESARRRANRDPVVLISGSGHVYGSAAARFEPLSEECPLEPVSPYAVSKAAQEMLGLQAWRSTGLKVIVTRSFNHTGPGQSPHFVAPSLAAQVREIGERGTEGSVKVGEPSASRDFTDVRDIVRAYIALTEGGKPGQVYNVCSGSAYTVWDLVRMLADIVGVEVRVETDPDRLRRVDIPAMVGSYAKLAEATAWQPEIDMRRSLTELVASLGARPG